MCYSLTDSQVGGVPTVLTPAERVGIARRRLDIRQMELAAMSGVGQSAISRWENGGDAKASDLIKVWAVLVRKGLSLQWLAFEEGPMFADKDVLVR